jgi:hypothetical protein
MKTNAKSPAAARMRRLRAERRRARTCRECDDPPVEGKKYCTVHLHLERMRMRRKRLQEERSR